MGLLEHLETIFNSSPVLGLLASFLAGVLVSFSPCVYPLIPVTLGVVGARSVNSRSRGFILSFIFVLGIACAYTSLGIIASLMGIFLAKFFLNPYVYFLLAFLFLLLGLSLFDIIKIPLLVTPVGYERKASIFSLFSLGFVSAFAITPCVFPVLGSILGIISLKQNVLYGAAALFLFSLGYGTLLLIVGTFSSFLVRLPKSGPWLIMIKRILGWLLFLLSMYFVFKAVELLQVRGGI